MRTGRTRYLVVVSRYLNKRNTSTSQQKLIVQTVPQSTITKISNTMTKIVLSSSSTTSHSNTENIYHQCPVDSKLFQDSVNDNYNEFGGNTVNKSFMNKEIDCDISRTEHRKKFELSTESNLKSNNNDKNRIEECCLLGIDCNETTTVGLVLKVLADTSIRLDGDG